MCRRSTLQYTQTVDAIDIAKIQTDVCACIYNLVKPGIGAVISICDVCGISLIETSQSFVEQGCRIGD